MKFMQKDLLSNLLPMMVLGFNKENMQMNVSGGSCKWWPPESLPDSLKRSKGQICHWFGFELWPAIAAFPFRHTDCATLT